MNPEQHSRSTKQTPSDSAYIGLQLRQQADECLRKASVMIESERKAIIRSIIIEQAITAKRIDIIGQRTSRLLKDSLLELRQLRAKRFHQRSMHQPPHNDAKAQNTPNKLDLHGDKLTNRLLMKLTCFIPLKLQEGLIGDLGELAERLRKEGVSEKKIRRFFWWQVFWAFIGQLKTLIWSSIGWLAAKTFSS